MNQVKRRDFMKFLCPGAAMTAFPMLLRANEKEGKKLPIK